MQRKTLVIIFINKMVCLISGFHHEVTKNCTLLGYYSISSGNFLPMLQDNLSVPSSGVKILFLTPEDGTGNPEECRSQNGL
jgi:hypothetical protein